MRSNLPHSTLVLRISPRTFQNPPHDCLGQRTEKCANVSRPTPTRDVLYTQPRTNPKKSPPPQIPRPRFPCLFDVRRSAFSPPAFYLSDPDTSKRVPDAVNQAIPYANRHQNSFHVRHISQLFGCDTAVYEFITVRRYSHLEDSDSGSGFLRFDADGG